MVADANLNPYQSPAAAPQPREQKERTPQSPISAKRELFEWLGLTPADFLVSVAGVAVIGMYFTKNLTADTTLAFAGVVLSLAACPLGMKRDPFVSEFTNGVKRVVYPVYVVAVIVGIIVHSFAQ